MIGQFSNEYNFLRGESYTIKTIPFDNIGEEIDDYPGLYSWYVRPKPNREEEIVPIIDQILQQSSLEASLVGNIRLSYEGRLTKKKVRIGASNNEMLRNMFLLAPYPLYVGMSIGLKKRLSTHVQQLLDCMKGSDCVEKYDGTIDSDEESGYFAARLASVFLRAKVDSLDCLYLRVYEYKDKGLTANLSSADKKEIRTQLVEVEKIANSVFNPVFGRR